MLLYISFPPGHEFSGLRPESSPIFTKEGAYAIMIRVGLPFAPVIDKKSAIDHVV
jgi:hypothetical protein